MKDHYNRIPLTGPGNKGKRERLNEVIRYLEKRLDKMNYDDAIANDLDLATGVAEGAVNYVVPRSASEGCLSRTQAHQAAEQHAGTTAESREGRVTWQDLHPIGVRPQRMARALALKDATVPP